MFNGNFSELIEDKEAMEFKIENLHWNVMALNSLLEKEKSMLESVRNEVKDTSVKGLCHLPNCPLSSLAQIDPNCRVHGHLYGVNLTQTSNDKPNLTRFTLSSEFPGAELEAMEQRCSQDHARWKEWGDGWNDDSALKQLETEQQLNSSVFNSAVPESMCESLTHDFSRQTANTTKTLGYEAEGSYLATEDTLSLFQAPNWEKLTLKSNFKWEQKAPVDSSANMTDESDHGDSLKIASLELNDIEDFVSAISNT